MKYFIMIFLILSLAALWQITEDHMNIYRREHHLTQLEAFVPTPKTIVETLFVSRTILLNELSYTIGRGLLGLAIGSSCALLMIIFFLYFPHVRLFLLPMMLAINAFPIVGFSPIIILLFGQGSWLGIVFISTLICYFPVLITLDKAVQEIDPELIQLFQIWEASKWQIFAHIELPITMPYFFSAMRLSIPASIIGATLGEWLGTKHGIGQLITIGFYQLKPGLVYASLFLLTITIMLMTTILHYIEQYFFRKHLG